ncbi:MAG TPA: thioesterase family protein [Planctomycetota bacterium]|nr:thioesterase family protein [Planctomycetota bacterium]
MSAFTTVIQVRFGHVDPAGIVYFPRIYDYVHDVFEELWEKHVGERYYRILCDDKVGFPLAHSEVDFKSPLRFGDRPVVRVTCFRLGRSSLGLRYVFEIDGRVCVDAKMTTVCVDLSTMKSIEMPARYRARFEAILEPK